MLYPKSRAGSEGYTQVLRRMDRNVIGLCVFHGGCALMSAVVDGYEALQSHAREVVPGPDKGPSEKIEQNGF